MNQQYQNISQNIQNGLIYLFHNQEKNGSFSYLSSSFPKTFSHAKNRHNTFFNALILRCLNQITDSLRSIKNPELKNNTSANINIQQIDTIKNNITEFLLFHKNNHWSWNYWLQNSSENQQIPYPDDLDDTFCALTAIYQYKPQLINGQVLAAIISLLTTTETQVGGPYKTWLVDSKAPKIWQDVDLAVNSNIAYFLALNGITLPNLTFLIENNIDQKKYHSPYYPTPYPIIYFISCSYTGSKRQQVIDYLINSQQQCWTHKQHQNNQQYYWQNSLNTALAISALINLGYSANKLKPSVQYLLNNLHHATRLNSIVKPTVAKHEVLKNKLTKNYFWPTNAFCLDPATGGQKYYAGSPALTTAFCLEALSKYQQAIHEQTRWCCKKNKQTIVASPNQQHSHIFLQQTLANTTHLLSTTQPTLKTQNLTLLNKFTKTKTIRQIVLFPYSFYLSLGKKMNSKKNELSYKFRHCKPTWLDGLYNL